MWKVKLVELTNKFYFFHQYFYLDWSIKKTKIHWNQKKLFWRIQWTIESTFSIHILPKYRLFVYFHTQNLITRNFFVFSWFEGGEAKYFLHLLFHSEPLSLPIVIFLHDFFTSLRFRDCFSIDKLFIAEILANKIFLYTPVTWWAWRASSISIFYSFNLEELKIIIYFSRLKLKQ